MALAPKKDPWAQFDDVFDTDEDLPTAAPSIAGLSTPGNIDLNNRPVVKNADGSISTVASASYNIDGKEVLLPTVTDDGRRLDPEKDRAEIVDIYRRTGKHLGIFDTPANATAYAQQLHLDQAQQYGGKDAFSQFNDANPAELVSGGYSTEGGLPGAQAMPEQTISKMAPEDEAQLLQILRTGTAEQARAFALSKGFVGQNYDEVIAARDKTGKVSKEFVYQFPKIEDQGGAAAAGRGFADVPTLGFLDEAGAVVDLLGGTAGRQNVFNSDLSVGDLLNRNIDINRAIIASDEENHPGARIAGQVVGALVVPSGLRNVGLNAGREALRAGATLGEARLVAAQAVRNRMVQMGAGTGAGYGAGSAEGGLGERAIGAGVGGAMGAATGGAIGLVGEAATPALAARAAAARAAPLTDAQQVAAAAGRQGMDVLPADVGGPMTRRLTGAGAQAPLSASPIIRAAQRVIDQGRGVRDRVAASIGQAADPEAAGESAAEGARSFIRSSRDRIGRIYDTAARLAGDIRLPLTNAKFELDEQIARLEAVPGGGKGLNDARELRAALEGDFTVQGIRDMRTEMFVAPEFRGTPVERRLKRIVDAAALDIEQGLTAAGKEDAARAFASADKQWSQRLKTMSRIIEPIVGKSEDRLKSGEEIIQALQRAGKGNAARLRGFLDSLPDEEAGIVRATLISRLGRATSSNQDAAGEAFSLGTFLTHWDTLSEGAKRAIMGEEGRAALNDLARVAQGTKEAQRFANFSNTSGGIWGNLGLLAGSAAYAPKTAAAAALAQLVGGKVLASPRFARWLARAPRTSLGGEAYLDRLTRIARAEPAIANDVLNLQQRLAEMFASTPTRAAADERLDHGGGVNGQDQQ